MMTVTLDDHFDNMFDDQIYQNYHTRCIGAPMHPRRIGASCSNAPASAATRWIIILMIKIMMMVSLDDQKYDDHTLWRAAPMHLLLMPHNDHLMFPLSGKMVIRITRRPQEDHYKA